MKIFAIFIVGFVAGLFTPELTNPHLFKTVTHFVSKPLVGGLDPLALALIALVFTGIYFARAKYKGGAK